MSNKPAEQAPAISRYAVLSQRKPLKYHKIHPTGRVGHSHTFCGLDVCPTDVLYVNKPAATLCGNCARAKS